MRRLLAVDTSSWWGGLALVEQVGDAAPQLVAEVGFSVPASHAIHLMPRIEWLLAELGWDRHSIDDYAAVRGPGSFTGIRVGLGTIRGLALAADRSAVGVGALPAVVEATGPLAGERLPVRDAGRGQLYLACYDASGSPPEELEAPRIGHPTDVLARTDEGAVAILAEGLESRWEEARSGLRWLRAPRHLAAAAARLALLRGDDGPEPLAPLYLRAPDAELKPRRR